MDVDKNIRFSYGLILTLFIVSIPMFGWKFWYSFDGLSTIDALLVSFAKIGAFGGLAMFAVSLILSGRYTFIEAAFGGLDKLYIAHRFYGTAGIVLLTIHPIALSILRSDGAWESFAFMLGLTDMFVLIGALSLYGFIALIVWSITAKVSYERFLLVHKALGLLFIMGVVHAFVLGSVIERSTFLAIYLGALCLIAITTFMLYTVMGDLLHEKMRYQVASVRVHHNTVVELLLKPKSVIMNFTPGQFAYVSFPAIDKSFHPFSIASGKLDSTLRLAVRMSGDFTQSLVQLEQGSGAIIKGPYGGFTFSRYRQKKQLWIAGGIGITPFLSGARSLQRSHERGKIELIYASEEKHPYGLDELQAIEERNPSFNVTHFHKEKFGHVSLEVLQEQLQDLHERVIFLCGPPVMMHVLQEEAERLGLEHQIHFEEFSYK